MNKQTNKQNKQTTSHKVLNWFTVKHPWYRSVVPSTLSKKAYSNVQMDGCAVVALNLHNHMILTIERLDSYNRLPCQKCSPLCGKLYRRGSRLWITAAALTQLPRWWQIIAIQRSTPAWGCSALYVNSRSGGLVMNNPKHHRGAKMLSFWVVQSTTYLLYMFPQK